MDRKVWFYICIFQSVVLIGVLIVCLWSPFAVPKVRKTDLKEFLNQFSENNNYLSDEGYIPDAKTAKIVGSRIVDNLTGHSWFGGVNIEYDQKNRLWKVNKGYLFSNGGFVVIEQDSGKIIKALLSK